MLTDYYLGQRITKQSDDLFTISIPCELWQAVAEFVNAVTKCLAIQVTEMPRDSTTLRRLEALVRMRLDTLDNHLKEVTSSYHSLRDLLDYDTREEQGEI